MSLLCLKATTFRNLVDLNLEPSPQLNLIYGANGSGKTSLLEAIHFLALGRSFRSHLASRIIQYDASSFTLFGSVLRADHIPINLAIEKSSRSKTKIKIGNDLVPSAAELAVILPLQLINPDTFQLLNAGPRHRREFLDWGVFHVEHSFFPIWQRFHRTLKQRNAALQRGASIEMLSVWNNELIAPANELAHLRLEYLNKLIPIATALLTQLIALSDLSISYYQGWDPQYELADVLGRSYHRDMVLGYTVFGPQRADIEIKINNFPAQDVLSRGEQKLLICALKLAQGILLRQLTAKQCIYLIDDLAAELDQKRRESVIKVLLDLQTQVFVTAVDRTALSDFEQNSAGKLFHVEHGEITAVL